MGGARGAFWGVMALALVLLAIRTTDVPLIDPDEPRFARTSVEMLQQGEFVVPQFEGRPRLSKPPLLHWLHLPLFRIAGVAEWTARLPSMAAALGLLLAVGAGALVWTTRRC